MTLESSAVIFQALKPLQPHWPHRPLRPRWPLQPQKPYFTKELPDSDGWIILGTKMTNSCQFLWNSSSKIQFFTDFSTFSAGGCWGQPMLLFWKLGQETQMSTPPEATRHHISTQLLVLLHLRAIYFSTFQYETPCNFFHDTLLDTLNSLFFWFPTFLLTKLIWKGNWFMKKILDWNTLVLVLPCRILVQI